MSVKYEPDRSVSIPHNINRLCYIISLVCVGGGTLAALMLIWLGLDSQLASRTIFTMCWLLFASLFTVGVNSAFARGCETTVDWICFAICLGCIAFGTLMGIVLIWIEVWHTFAWKALSSSFVVFCAAIGTAVVQAAFRGRLHAIFSPPIRPSGRRRARHDEDITVVEPENPRPF